MPQNEPQHKPKPFSQPSFWARGCFRARCKWVAWPLAFWASLMLLVLSGCWWGLGQAPVQAQFFWFTSGEQLQQKKQELKNKKQDLESQRQEISQKKQAKLQQARYHEGLLVQSQRKLENAHAQLQNQEYVLQSTQFQIVSLTGQLDKTVGDTTRLARQAGHHLRRFYMGERLTFLQMILDARDLSTLLDRVYYRQKILAQDQKVLVALKSKSKQLARQKQSLHQQKQKVGQTIEKIQDYRSQVAVQAKTEAALRQKYLSDAQYYERLERELLAESNSIERELRNLGRVKVLGSTGRFAWPVAARISSNFGYRFHPIHRRRILHTGLDLAARSGTPVHASDGGKVYFAGWRGGYGKAVIINHGNRGGVNYSTLYGHLSAISVGSGQNISKGQVLGAVGSTGNSTGPHLHFEVRENGAPTDPLRHLR